MLKHSIQSINKGGIYYILQEGGRIKNKSPWIGNFFAFIYDFIMQKSVFPKKLDADINQHFTILKQALKEIHNQNVLELAAGSGDAVNFLNNDNHYAGIDISPGLLRLAIRKFRVADFRDAKFYLTSADDLPFQDGIFDVCICIMALNFFRDLEKVISELARVLKPGALFFCAVPVPERNSLGTAINGTLLTEQELKTKFENFNLQFASLPVMNGAILYFKVTF